MTTGFLFAYMVVALFVTSELTHKCTRANPWADMRDKTSCVTLGMIWPLVLIGWFFEVDGL